MQSWNAWFDPKYLSRIVLVVSETVCVGCYMLIRQVQVSGKRRRQINIERKRLVLLELDEQDGLLVKASTKFKLRIPGCNRQVNADNLRAEKTNVQLPVIET